MRKCSTRKSNGMNPEPDVTAFFTTRRKPAGNNRYLLRLLHMIIQNDPIGLLLQLVVMFLCTFFPVITAIFWKNIVNYIASPFGLSDRTLVVNFALYAIIGAASVSCFFFTEVLDSRYRNKLSLSFQKRIFEKSRSLPLIYHEIPQLQDQMTRAQDTFCYGPAIGTALEITGLISMSVTFVASFMLLYDIHPLLMAAFAPLVLPYFIQIYLSKLRVQLNLTTSPLRRNAAVYAGYASKYEFVKETKFFDLGDYFTAKWENTLHDMKQEELKSNRKTIAWTSVLELLDAAFYMLIIFVSVLLVGRNQISVGEFGAVYMLIGTVKLNASRLLRSAGGLHEDIQFIRQGFDFLDLKEEQRSVTDSPSLTDVRCENVSFTYPLTDRKVIDHVNATFSRNEITAFVGANGAGKSTLAKLLLGIFTPSEGTVTYDGQPIEEVAYQKLHQNTSAVFQDFNHYYMTLRENVGISDSEYMAHEDKIHTALQWSQSDALVQSLPEGLDTMLGKEFGGTELSGGQWQSLAIARGCFRDAEFIVLDEPSSALDPLKESEIYHNFREICRGKIGIIVTHRLSAATLADKICFIENGNITEQGSHEQLMHANGQYARMFTAQAQLYNG